MNSILLDFQKTFATINNKENQKKHYDYICNLVNNFHKKYYYKYSTSTHYLVLILRVELIDLKARLYGCT